MKQFNFNINVPNSKEDLKVMAANAVVATVEASKKALQQKDMQNTKNLIGNWYKLGKEVLKAKIAEKVNN